MKDSQITIIIEAVVDGKVHIFKKRVPCELGATKTAIDAIKAQIMAIPGRQHRWKRVR